MTSKRRSSSPGGIPWPVVAAAAHAGFDLATHASRPDCGDQVVL
jgi:hypothetical protein